MRHDRSDHSHRQRGTKAGGRLGVVIAATAGAVVIFAACGSTRTTAKTASGPHTSNGAQVSALSSAPDYSSLTKEQRLQRMQSASNQAEANRERQKQAGSVPAPPTFAMNPPVATGVLDQRDGPFSSSSFVVFNAFQQRIAGVWYMVYAGEIPKNPTNLADGASPALRVYVDRSAADVDQPSYGPPQNYTTYPSPAGQFLKIASASGATLHLVGVDDASQSAEFNLATMSFNAG